MIRSTATPSPYKTSFGSRYDPSQLYGMRADGNPPDFIGGMPGAIGSPDPTGLIAAPISSGFVGGMPQGQARQAQPVEQSGNAVQRWQSGKIAFRRQNTGLIDAHAPQSPLDTTPSGVAANSGTPGQFAPQAQWNSQFSRQINIPKAEGPSGGFSWDIWYPTAGGNPNAPALPVNQIPATTKPDYNQPPAGVQSEPPPV